ncbi:MAG: ribbon-helix-helix domain-containing protein [Bacteroidales bacterium]
MIVRIDPELKEKVSSLARSEGKNISEIVRELLEGYVKDRDIEAYVDDLWGRINTRLNAHGADPEDIPRVINEVRSRKS